MTDLSPAPGSTVYLAVALEGAGWHPAAWREPAARPGELFDAGYWVDLVQQAERGHIDFVTVEDSFGLSTTGAAPDQRTDRVRGRLDALLVTARVAPVTSTIGLVPTIVVTHTEPFHVAKAIASLDYVSTGRAGVRVQVSPGAQEAAHFGRRVIPDPPPPEVLADLLDEAGDHVEVMRRLWDSWEDDAEIRDSATGRFLDRDKVHYIDFRSKHFSVKGPSIVPRPPQGQPLVTVLAHGAPAYRLAATAADLVFTTPSSLEAVSAVVMEITAAQEEWRSEPDPLLVFADIVVFLDSPAESGADRKARLDRLAGEEIDSDAWVFTGSAKQLAELVEQWHAAGLDGFRLRPGALPDDLSLIVDTLIPELQQRGLFRATGEITSLRGRLGLGRPANRYPAMTVGQGVSS